MLEDRRKGQVRSKAADQSRKAQGALGHKTTWILGDGAERDLSLDLTPDGHGEGSGGNAAAACCHSGHGLALNELVPK